MKKNAALTTLVFWDNTIFLGQFLFASCEETGEGEMDPGKEWKKHRIENDHFRADMSTESPSHC